jgi:hypothetical protein
MISDTELRDIGTDHGHNPRDLVTQHCRRWNDIVSSEQKVGMTQAGRLHLDENFAPNRGRDVHVLEIEPATECVNYKRLHLWPPCSCRRTSLMFQAGGRGIMGRRFAGFEVLRFPRNRLGLGPLLSAFRLREFDKDYLIRPRHLYYQINRDKLSEWNCGI